ncbi:MAG TPA: hypothetical protein VHY91_09085, partial [Pirellulales bacterium]|nr:hypothetical protein [Pirellulales bacterium]
SKVLMGAGAAGFLLVLLGVIFMLKTKDGTLVIEVNQPDATVQVLDPEGKVEISQPGGLEPISIFGRSRQAPDSGGEGRLCGDCDRGGNSDRPIAAASSETGGEAERGRR